MHALYHARRTIVAGNDHGRTEKRDRVTESGTIGIRSPGHLAIVPFRARNKIKFRLPQLREENRDKGGRHFNFVAGSQSPGHIREEFEHMPVEFLGTRF